MPSTMTTLNSVQTLILNQNVVGLNKSCSMLKSMKKTWIWMTAQTIDQEQPMQAENGQEQKEACLLRFHTPSPAPFPPMTGLRLLLRWNNFMQRHALGTCCIRGQTTSGIMLQA